MNKLQTNTRDYLNERKYLEAVEYFSLDLLL